MEEKKKILILGAGFGGLRAALELERLFRKRPELLASHEIILIDRHGYHLFTPTLYEISTTPLVSAKNKELALISALPIKESLRKKRITFLQKTIADIDLRAKNIQFSDGSRLEFEYLIIALGSETNFFAIPGLQEYALPLKTFYDALHIRQAVDTLFANPQKQISRILIGGGGATGVELAGELALWRDRYQKEKGGHVRCKITILEAASEILPGIHPKIIRAAKKRLQDLGVELLTNSPIAQVNSSSVELSSGETLPYDLLVWAGGSKANQLLFGKPIKQEKRGRAEVTGIMECVSPDPHLDFGGKIYAVGDATCLYDPKSGRPFPAVAPAAIEHGKIAARNIFADIIGSKKFEYQAHEYPYAIPIGGKWAAAKIGPIIITGIFGWILKGLAEGRYLVSILPLRLALKIWIKGFFILIRND